MRARRIKAVKGYHFRGKTPSIKNRCMVHWESLLERDLVNLLEFDPYVAEYEFQPLKMLYTHKNKRKVYFPDFKVLTIDNRTIVIEVKPSEYLYLEKNMVKYHAGINYCQQRGWEFVVLTETQIRPGHLQYNLDLLLDLFGCTSPTYVDNKVLAYLSSVKSCRLHQVYSELSDIPERLLCRSIYTLIYSHRIKTDLMHTKLSDHSVICVLQSNVGENAYEWI